MTTAKSLREASCADDYDPNSMPVAKARELIATFLAPVTAVERVRAEVDDPNLRAFYCIAPGRSLRRECAMRPRNSHD